MPPLPNDEEVAAEVARLQAVCAGPAEALQSVMAPLGIRFASADLATWPLIDRLLADWWAANRR